MSTFVELSLELKETQARLRGAIRAMSRAIGEMEDMQGDWLGVADLYAPQWVNDLRGVLTVLEDGVKDAQDMLSDERPNITLPIQQKVQA